MIARTISRLAMLALAFLGLFAVAVSPVLVDGLSGVDGIGSLDWVRLSSIGETYGAAAAVLSALAFISVTMSLTSQIREARASRVQSVRGHHEGLLKMAAENPRLYGHALGFSPAADPEDVRRRVYAVMLMNYLRVGYELGVIPESSLRGEALAGMFQSEMMRKWWSNARPYWGQGMVTRKERRFLRIVDDEYARSIAAGPSAIPYRDLAIGERPCPRPTRRGRGGSVVLLLVGAMAGGALVWAGRSAGVGRSGSPRA
jgi:hypothetical protein